MSAPRWRKVFKDLWGNKVRTFLVMSSIAVGVFAVGFVTTAFILILTDMDADYQSANPHAAILYTSPFNDELLDSLNSVPGVGQVEGRSSTAANLLVSDEQEYLIGITAIPPVNQIRIDLIRPNRPGDDLSLEEGEILIERSALGAIPMKAGDILNIKLMDGRLRKLRVAAIVHEVTGFPFAFSQQVSGYVNQQTLEWLGGSRDYNQVYLTVSEQKTDETHVRNVAAAVADKLERGGRDVGATIVFKPGRHFASDITRALGVMMGFLGALAVLLSAFLVVNTINALVSQQVRQIGVMKAVGATTGQLVGMYLVLVLFFGLLALLISIPLSSLAAYTVVQGIGLYLNFNIGLFRIPVATILLQTAVALLVPIVAAVVPVWRGTRLTVREAITSYGLGGGRLGRGWFDRMLESIRGLPRPLLISLRNTFRRKARLLLTLSTLILAGAIFIAVFNLRAAMDVAIQQTFGYILADVNLFLDRPYRIQKLKPMVMSVPGVVDVEGWGGANAEVLSADRSTSTQVSIYAPPGNSDLINPTLTSGRWLLPQDENALVIGNHLTKLRPELNVGDQVLLRINDQESTWNIVGIYEMAGNMAIPIVYTNGEYLSELLGEIGTVSSLRVITEPQDLQTQQRVGRQLKDAFEAKGIQIAQVLLAEDLAAQNTSQTDILVYFLLVMAGLIALVGGLGLTSTMTMNVIERTREIGVMRAIGASNGAIYQLVIVEGILIGVISWIVGAILAVPISMGLNMVVGVAFVQSPLNFVFSWDGFLVWLGMVVFLSALASIIPARSASRLTVREVLAYE